MKNKILFQDISKNNNIKLLRNYSLDSTNSSLRVKKINMQKEFSPFVKITQNTNIKNILDFPICISLFTNNNSLSEKNRKIKNNSTTNLGIKNIKNDILNKNNQNNKNELILPKTKRIISRNVNSLLAYSFTPINSVVKSSILNYNKFPMQSFRNIPKSSLHKNKNIPLIKFTRKTDNNEIKILKNYDNYSNKNYSYSNRTLEQEISAIKNEKNTLVGNINSDVKIRDYKKLKLPLQFFTQKENGGKNENRIFPKRKINLNEINKMQKNLISEEANSKNQNDNIKRTINNKFGKFKLLENIKIKDNIGINKLKYIINNKNNNNSNIINKNNNNGHKKKIDNHFNDSNEELIEKKIMKRKNEALFLQSIINKENENIKLNDDNKKLNEEKEKYPKNLMIDKEKLLKIKQNKFYLAINNKKTIEKYNRNIFLNDLNKTINNSINTKIFLQKTEMLINNKENIEKMINKYEGKLKQKYFSPLSQTSKKNSMSIYLKDIYCSDNKIRNCNNIIISMIKIKYNFTINCILCYNLINYLFLTTEFGEVSLTNKSQKKYTKRGSVVQNLKYNLDFKNFKRQNTFLPIKKIYIYNDLEDGFSLQKSKNNIKKDLKIKNNPTNLISIQDYILKSLPFYNERFFMKKDYRIINNNIKNKSNENKNKLFKKSLSRKISKKIVAINNIGLNSSKKLLYQLSLKSTGNKEKDLLARKNKKQLSRRGATIFTLDDFAKSLKNQIYQKFTDINMENYSILQSKNFFKKTIKNSKKNIKNTTRENNEINSNKYLNEKENEKEDLDEDLINYEEIYFELIKFIIEGKNKNFEKYFEKNKNYIEINQELYEGNTLLILSAKEGNYYITKFLCERKAEVNLQNNIGNTALHYAIGKQFYAIADILTRYGAREDIKNAKGLTPWDCIEHNIE